MPLSRNISTAFFVLTLCLIQLCLLQVSVGESQPDGELDRRYKHTFKCVVCLQRNSISLDHEGSICSLR